MAVSQNRRWVPILAIIRCFPITYQAFTGYVIASTLLNGGSLVVSMFQPSLFERWLAVSQPVTDWASQLIPSVDYAVRYLESGRGHYIVPAMKNSISFNFMLLGCFAICVMATASIDVAWDGSKIFERVDKIYAEHLKSIPEMIGKYILFLLIIFPLMYFWFGVRPYAVNLQLNYILYFVQFTGLGAFLGVIVAGSLAYWCGGRRSTF